MKRDAQDVVIRVFIFCRPYLVPDFEANVAPLRGPFEFNFLTDGQCAGVPDTRQRFYARLGVAPRPEGFTGDDELDVIERCRFLRNLARPMAVNMLRSMASVLAEELDRYQPAVVLSHMVDDYITHLLAELTRRRGLVYVGFAYSYFPGKAQVTQFGHGMPLNVRAPSDGETADVLEQISTRTFRQNYKQKDTYTRMRHIMAMLRYRAKQVVFAWHRWRQRDSLHMHFACLPYVVERRHWRDFPADSDFHCDWRRRIESGNDGSSRPLLYFPLGYFPEATIDYWIENRKALQYEQLVGEICATLGQHFRVVVKEHLHMVGARNTAFYRHLRDLPGVTSVPPLEFSNDVLNAADVVLMGAGSIGVESFIRGKPIVSFCDRSYWFSHARATPLDLDTIPDWPGRIHAALAVHITPSPEERFEFVRQCLRSTMRQARPGVVWPICDPDDLAAAIRTATTSMSVV